MTWIIDFPSWQTKQILCLDWRALIFFFPISVFPHVKWCRGRGQNKQNLPKKSCQGGTRKRFVRQAPPSELIQDNHFRTCGRSGEMLNGRSRAVEGCCAWRISLSSVSPASTEFKIWKWLTCLPFSSWKSGAQLSHVLGDHPGFHVSEDQEGAEGAGGFSCCHCSAQIK